MDERKEYFPVTLRTQVAATVLPANPFGIDLVVGADHLGYIEFVIATAGIVQTAGVRVLNNGNQIYPAVGSRIDASAGLAGTDDFGVLYPSGLVLKVPFNKRLRGGSNLLRFEFYNTGAALVAINVLIVTYSEVRQKLTGEMREAFPVAKESVKA